MIDYTKVHACQHDWGDLNSDSTRFGVFGCRKCGGQAVYAPGLASQNNSNYSIVDYARQDAKWERMLGKRAV